MIEKYFDFEKMWNEEAKPSLNDIENYIEDVELDNITPSEAVKYLKDMPFPLYLKECELRLEEKEILFDFSETCNQPTESDSYQGFVRVYITWSIKDECILCVGYEQG